MSKYIVKYFPATSQSGELGASAIRVNVDVSGYPTSNFTTQVMKNTITNLLRNNGWGVYSVSISISPTTRLYYISVVINAARNTADELEKIKQGVGNILRTVLPLSTIEASFAGSAANNPINNGGSARTYTIAGTLGDNLGYVGRGISASTIRSEILHYFASKGWNVQTLDFDWYSDEQQYRFRMTALVNANFSLQDVKQNATAMFQTMQAGAVLGRPLGNYFTNVRLDAATGYVAPRPSSNTNNSTNTNFGLPGFQLPDLPGDSFLGGLGKGLGLSSPYALVAGAFILILIARR